MNILKILEADFKKYDNILKSAPYDLLDLKDIAIRDYLEELIKRISKK